MMKAKTVDLSYEAALKWAAKKEGSASAGPRYPRDTQFMPPDEHKLLMEQIRREAEARRLADAARQERREEAARKRKLELESRRVFDLDAIAAATKAALATEREIAEIRSREAELRTLFGKQVKALAKLERGRIPRKPSVKQPAAASSSDDSQYTASQRR